MTTLNILEARHKVKLTPSEQFAFANWCTGHGGKPIEASKNVTRQGANIALRRAFAKIRAACESPK